MTVKRNEKGDLERILSSGDYSFRTILIFLVVSMHPIGQQVLVSLGFPDLRTNGVKSVANELQDIKREISELRTKVERVEFSVMSFSATAKPKP